MMLSEPGRGPRHDRGGSTIDVVSAVLSMCSDAFVLLRPVRNPDGDVVDFVCVLANQVLETTVGVSNNDVVGNRLAQFLPEVHDHLPSLVDVLETGSPWRTAVDVDHAGLRRPVSVRATLVSTGRQDDVMLALNDRTEVHRLVEVINGLRERQHELEIQALHDPLTGCANRLLIESRLEHGISRLDRHSGSLAVMFVDLDPFKDVNDAHGHAAGDAVLITMADRLRSQGSHLGWYVNLQEPMRRNPIGFEAMDLMIDIVVEPKLSWRWKDLEEFDESVRREIFDPNLGEQVRATALSMIEDIEHRRSTNSSTFMSARDEI